MIQKFISALCVFLLSGLIAYGHKSYYERDYPLDAHVTGATGVGGSCFSYISIGDIQYGAGSKNCVNVGHYHARLGKGTIVLFLSDKEERVFLIENEVDLKN